MANLGPSGPCNHVGPCLIIHCFLDRHPIDFVTLENFDNTEGIEKEGYLTAT